MRTAVMRQFMGDRTDQRRLAIAPSGAANPGALGRAGFSPVTANNQPPGQHGPIAQRHLCPMGINLLRGDRAFDLGDLGLAIQSGQKRLPEIAVLDHVAHRAFVNFAVAKFQHKRRGAFARFAVRDLHVQNLLRMSGHFGPNPDGLQKPLRGQGQSIAAAIKGITGACRLRQRVNQTHAQPSIRTGQRQGRAIETAADDDHIA